jgi:acetate kinase
MHSRILTINGGSSTIKFAVFISQSRPEPVLRGKVDRIGRPDAVLTANDKAKGEEHRVQVRGAEQGEAAGSLIHWLNEWNRGQPPAAIGHRVVHGGVRLDAHQRVTPELIDELCRALPLSLAHLPGEIALIQLFVDRFPEVPQYACFDTAFHRELPRTAQILPIPRRFLDAGVRRLGFHGLSCMYLMKELRRIDPVAAQGKVILAHLGSGASLTAVHRGHPVDTSMAFTPTAGLVMGTRPGDLDPGLLLYMMHNEKLTPEQMNEFVNEHCGLAGVSAASSDMRDLMERRASDARAAEAIDLFCYEAKKWAGAYAAALGGLDTLIFAGGIGERSPEVRAAICEGLGFLGLELHPELNRSSAAVISDPGSRVTVRVIPTDEELMIADIVFDLMSDPAPRI